MRFDYIPVLYYNPLWFSVPNFYDLFQVLISHFSGDLITIFIQLITHYSQVVSESYLNFILMNSLFHILE